MSPLSLYTSATTRLVFTNTDIRPYISTKQYPVLSGTTAPKIKSCHSSLLESDYLCHDMVSFNELSGTTEILISISTRRHMMLLNRICDAHQLELKRLSVVVPDDNQPSDDGESAKSANARWRGADQKSPQGRHTRHILMIPFFIADDLCRKHRERKETYIKSLEQQVLTLLDQQATAA